MANSLHLPLFLLLSILAAHKALASSHNHDQDLRFLQFSLFQHETINKTGYIVVDGVAGTGFSETTTPFGTIFVFRDNMTTSLNDSSGVVGIAEGTSITTSFDGLRSLLFAKITLKTHGYEGSVSILGVVHNTKPADLPISGGTGDFTFVQGYVRMSPVDLHGLTVLYKIEFHLYWPPYATNGPK
ncbi:dirigent protein 7 [Cocos nucifera]|uniref:Dirigent protein n=1 Tax=Cocos nucifera TaxID=13894 RepID=A0A8K0IK24_COCNU|nr:dirigent protein 7 [Cocos nucifera]